jgi:hypothetical protein
MSALMLLPGWVRPLGVTVRLHKSPTNQEPKLPKHDVEMRIPTTKVVLSADVVFEIRSDNEKLGELRVSKGSIDWSPSKAKNPRQLTWEQFDRFMREQHG